MERNIKERVAKQKGKTKPTRRQRKKEKRQKRGGGTMESAEEMMVQVNVMKENESALDKQFSCRA
jgi:hypothetical protein